MSIFLIDYENVRSSAFNGLEELTEDDRIIVFYTNNSDNLTFSLMQRLCSAKAKIDYLKVASGGKNSLDFQLCSYLGYLIGTHSNTRFCIISKDKGFFTMLSLWGENTENGNSVICSANIHNGNGHRSIDENETVDEAMEETSAEVNEPAQETEEPAPEPVVEAAEEQTDPEEKQESAPEEKPAEKPKRKYNRRTPYKRKPKAPEEQTA